MDKVNLYDKGCMDINGVQFHGTVVGIQYNADNSVKRYELDVLHYGIFYVSPQQFVLDDEEDCINLADM